MTESAASTGSLSSLPEICGRTLRCLTSNTRGERQIRMLVPMGQGRASLRRGGADRGLGRPATRLDHGEGAAANVQQYLARQRSLEVPDDLPADPNSVDGRPGRNFAFCCDRPHRSATPTLHLRRRTPDQAEQAVTIGR
jgi:hypothetical protein